MGFSGGLKQKRICLRCGDLASTPGLERSLEKGMAAHSSILAWRVLWTEEPGGLQSVGSQRVRHNWVANTFIRRQPSDDHVVSALPCGERIHSRFRILTPLPVHLPSVNESLITPDLNCGHRSPRGDLLGGPSRFPYIYYIEFNGSRVENSPYKSTVQELKLEVGWLGLAEALCPLDLSFPISTRNVWIYPIT